MNDPSYKMPAYQPIFALTRGEVVESIHYGAVAVVDAQGRLVAWHGDAQAVTYLRSSAKPFQVLPLLEHGGGEVYGFTAQEVALMCASHSGTDEHVAVLQSIQAKTGVREAELLCGTHPLGHKPTIEAMRARGETVTPNRHNCSGKHTGMLAYARLRGGLHSPVSPPYIDPTHPVQQDILNTFASMCDLPPVEVKVGIDGCSAPNFAVPLYHAALAFARLCDPADLDVQCAAACRTVTQAMRAFPEMVGGPDSFDTHLMRAMQGRLVCKGGAEGYQGIGLLPGALGTGSPALGIVFKVSDGDLKGHSRPVGDPRGYARPAIALEILRQMGLFDQQAQVSLSDYGPEFSLYNWRDLCVGHAFPCFKLTRNNG